MNIRQNFFRKLLILEAIYLYGAQHCLTRIVISVCRKLFSLLCPNRHPSDYFAVFSFAIWVICMFLTFWFNFSTDPSLCVWHSFPCTIKLSYNSVRFFTIQFANFLFSAVPVWGIIGALTSSRYLADSKQVLQLSGVFSAWSTFSQIFILIMIKDETIFFIRLGWHIYEVHLAWWNHSIKKNWSHYQTFVFHFFQSVVFAK